MYRLTILIAALISIPTYQLQADPIHDAAADGDTAAVRLLLDQNASLIASPDTAQNLPIHLAVSRGQASVVELLLSRGADIEAGDREHTTPLTVAAMLNQPGIVRILADGGASLTARDDNGITPLLAAVRCGNIETVRFLVERGASLADVSGRGSNCLHIAASVGALDIVAYLTRFEFDYNALNGGGFSPLHFAAMSGSAGVIRLLAAKGAVVDLPDRSGMTPLLHAVYANRPEAARALVDLGANINFTREARRGEDQSVLTAAIWGGNVEIVSYLIERGADLNQRNQEGESALHIAAAKGDTAIARLLVTHGLDVNEPTEFGMVPLCMAAYGQPVMAQWLIDQGAKVDGSVRDAAQPLNYAANSGNLEIVRILLANGAEVDSRKEGWSTPLLHAVTDGCIEVARALLEAGADPNLVGVAAQQTPLHFAARNGQSEMVTMLLDHGAKVDPPDTLGRTPLFYAARYDHISAAAALTAHGAKTSGPVDQRRAPIALSEAVPAGEAAVSYLGHSGWAVRTQNHFLVFDYWQAGFLPDEPCLANGYVVPSEIAGLPVTVFSSHEHADHYDTVMFQWRDQIPNINYVFGHHPRDRQGFEYVGPGESKDLPGMKVSAIRATDAGVGFVVEVDGLTIFHAGDHAAGQVELPAAFTSEIDYIAERWPGVDLAFLPISGCSLGTPESVRAGDFYILNKLHPKAVFPQHAMNGELAYFDFKREAERAGFTERIECAEHRGDLFRFVCALKL